MSTLLLGLIGAGIQRSLSPALHEEEGRHHGLRVHYQLIDLDAAGAAIEALPALLSAVRIIGFAGINVTYPCKQAVMPLLDSLSEEARASKDLRAALADASGLIHATPTGMAQVPGMAVPEQLLRRAMWVSDIVYVPLETPLLKAARRIGCATVDGGHMNVGQAVRGFKLFTGRDADAARMEAHFRACVS